MNGRTMATAASAALLVLALFGAGCGGDDDANAKADAGGKGPGKGMDASTGSQSDGGSPGKKPTGGGSDKDASTTGGGGGSSNANLDGAVVDEDSGIEQCGAVECALPMCCADPFASMCGVQISEVACLLPVENTMSSDPRCPDVSIMNGAFSIPSCCTDDGKCGINAQQAGMGCISLEEVIMYTMSMGGVGAMIPWPEPKACN